MTTRNDKVSLATLRSWAALIADDEPSVRFFIRHYLQALGITAIAEASNGQEAVDVVSNCPKFQIVFMDMKMPVMDGVEAIPRIRAMSPSAFIVVLTGYPKYPGLFNSSPAIGAFLMKPIEIEDLDHAVTASQIHFQNLPT